jgi:AcrR family transcriptional regulator
MPKPDVSDQRKPQILAAALRVFSRLPYEAVSVREIAREARLSIGGIYWYFKSKDEILAALLQQLAEENLALLRRLVESDAPAAPRLTRLIEYMAEQVETVSPLYLTGAKYHVMLSADPSSRSLMEQIGAAYREGIAALIEQGIARGEFARVNPAEAALALISAYEGLMLLWVISPQTMRLKEAMQTAAQLLLRGLRP